jgi:MOSC domain-containing protein YiiM
MFKVLSVNVGKPVPFEHTGPKVTGIFKKPQSSPVWIGTNGLAGDAICDVEHHGGPDQAVYVYGQSDYDVWSSEIGKVLEPGTFGENLTLASFESAKINIGDRLVCGSLVLEATSPRIPCRTFAARMEDKHFVKKFLDAGRPGVYCRVLGEGPVQVGDTFAHIQFAGERIPVVELNDKWNRKDLQPHEMRRYLATPIHEKSRQKWEKLLGN